MPTEPLALSKRPPEPAADTDYDAICAAVTATARGRWFLTEFARRNRHSDTAQVLAAIARMEAAVTDERAQHASQQANQQVRIELLEMVRTIAQTRAEVAESLPQPPASAAGPAGTTAATPDVTAAAERLRQIAWTMRACGVEITASDQVGQIADTILAADAVHSLGDQRSHKLTEVLHYLEHRIERMLDTHLAAANAADAAAASDAAPPQTNVRDQTAAIASAMRALAPVDVAPAINVKADIEPTSSSIAREAAMAAAATRAADATAFAVDDDVMLTVADSADDIAPPPATSAASEPEALAATSTDPDPVSLANSNMPELQVERVELGPEPMPVAMPTAEPNADANGDRGEPAPSSAHSRESASPGALSQDRVPAHAGTSGPQDESKQLQIAAPPASPPLTAAEANAIAMQVDQDLDVLTDAVADGGTHETAVAAQEPPAQAPVIAAAADDDDPADFLLDPPAHPDAPTPTVAPPVAASDQVPNRPASRTQLSNTPTEIETELFAGGATPPATRAQSPATPIASAAVKPTAPSVTDGPLAPLMAMSEEERIAMFS